jgi:hypothetical protein
MLGLIFQGRYEEAMEVIKAQCDRFRLRLYLRPSV